MRRMIASFMILSSFTTAILYAQTSKDVQEVIQEDSKVEEKKKQKSSEVIWKPYVDNRDVYDSNFIWKKIEDKDNPDLENNNNLIINSPNYEIKESTYAQYLDLPLLDLGRSVPTANTLSKGDLQINFSQITPFKEAYYNDGTGNQNYSASISYGLTDSLMIEGFYSHSDDHLHKKIAKFNTPVANRWIIYGTSLTWQFIKNNDLLIALNSSVENWNIKSGGCNSYNCSTTSNNIFTDIKEEVINDNIVGSISLPIKYRLTNKIDFNLVPRYISLPSSQSKGSTSGNFYGSSFGVGTGLEYKLLKNIKSYGSLYFPVSSGYNNFDEHLSFKKKTIYNAGILYSLDSKIALEAGVTNAFGLSPSIGTLTLPSSDQLLYKTSLIYRPKKIDLPLKKLSKKNRLRLTGLSVSTAESLKSGEAYANYYLNNNGSWANKIVWGASDRFDFDISFSSIGQNLYSDKPFDGKYHDTDALFVRGGGKALFLSQMNGDFITSAARVSAGRLRGHGWLFTELINTYSFNDNFSLNLNPKISFSGIASPSAIGTSLNWQILQDISLIPEYNFSLNESTDNWTIAIRFTQFHNINLDVFTTNSLNFIDTGQLQRSDSNAYGFNIGFIF